MKFSVVNLGCKVNRVESDTIAAQLREAGWEEGSDADVVVVNTCTVTAEANHKTRKAIRQSLVRHSHARVFVTGCAAAINAAEIEAMDSRVSCVLKDQVVKRCLQTGGMQGCVPASGTLRVGGAYPTRVGVKVQDGCDNACTFCIVHTARGAATSPPFDACVDQVRALGQAGVREVVLTGIDLGAYSFEGKGLADLVLAMRSVASKTRLRISSIEPSTISEAFVDVLATANGMVCRHVHIPLQSGSDAVLHAMGRHYGAQEYIDIVGGIRAAIPSLSLSTDIIVGFPGETDADFRATIDVVKQCGFSRIHVFRYSPRQGTPAAAFPLQVPAEVKAARFDELSKLAYDMRIENARSRIGSRERVLVEGSGRGMTESYFNVQMPQDAKPGSLEEYVLRDITEDGCFLV